MKRDTFYIGLNDQTTKEQVIDTDDAIILIEDECKLRFGGATLSKCKGVYTHSFGATIRENTIKVEVLDCIDICAKNLFIASMKSELNQESILHIKDKVNATFS
jgi:hypothetical protein